MRKTHQTSFSILTGKQFNGFDERPSQPPLIAVSFSLISWDMEVIVMSKEQFISKIANRVKMSPADVEGLVDATLAEIVSPSVFGTSAGLAGIFDNNCNNNCKAELAERAPVLQR